MLRGYYTAAAGMLAQQRRQDVLSNNMANVYTPGFKADQGSFRAFPEMLIEQMGTKNIPTKNSLKIPTANPIGSLNTGVYMQETIPDFAQGDINQTGVGTDMALVNGDLPDKTGALFFTVKNQDGDVRYTRNGNFTVDGQGYLTTNQGYYVLDDQQNPIQTDNMDFTVSSDGTLRANGQATPLGITYQADANQMVKEGNGLYRLEGNGAVAARTVNNVSFQVKQSYLEGSNVDPVQNMTEMMQTYRMFETNQRVLKAYDKSMELAVNEIGKLR